MRGWLRSVWASALGLCIIGHANAQTVSSSPVAAPAIRVAVVSRTVFYVPLSVAMQAGYFSRLGLIVDIEVFDNAEKIADALRSGAVQIAISTPETVIVDAAKGPNLRIVGGNAERLPHFVIAKPEIKSPSQLKGAVFGVLSLNEGTTYLVHEYARSIGLAEGDYEVKQVGGAPTRWKLLREGKIDAALQPTSSTRLMLTVSFQGMRTTGATGYEAAACNWDSSDSRSLGACSQSSSNQSNPAPATTSTQQWLARLHQRPIGCRPAARTA